MNEDLINRIWDKANPITGFNPDIWRQDFAGAWIRKDHYGLHNKYGWEIDHVEPKSSGGTDDLDNLQPLHWRNNESKKDDFPSFSTVVTSEGKINIVRIRKWLIRR